MMSHPVGTELYEHAPCGHLLLRPDGLVVRANRLFGQWCEWLPEQIEGRMRLQDFLSPGCRIFHATHYVPLLELQGFAHEISFELRTRSGALLPVLVNAQVQHAPDGRHELTSVTVFNASATRRHERALSAARREAERVADELADRNAELQAQQERLQVTLQSMTDAVVTVDAAGRIESLNPAAAELLAIENAQALGRPFEVVVRLLWADDRQPRPCPVLQCLQTGDVQRQTRDSLLRAHDGRLCHVSDTVAPIRSAQGDCSGALWMCRDFSEQHRLAEHAAHAVRHDALTGLLNRHEFERVLARAVAGSASEEPEHLLCYIDLDQFKVVNDTLSHAAGDALLREIAQLLRDGVRQSDTLARLGGDEFGVLLEGCGVATGIERAQALRSRIEAHRFDWEGGTRAVTASLGLVQLPGVGGQPFAALIHADIACHAAKEAGRNRVQFFDQADAQVQSRRGEMHWVTRLRRALAEDRFVLFCQPIVSTAVPPGPVSHGEILLRLRGEDGQLVPPALFIPAAERYQLMGALDRCVLRKAVAWMQRTPGVQCSINVSGQSLGDAGFLADAVELIGASGIDPRRLCFEITETAAIANLEAAREFMTRLHALGARFALDDFGAGLSSFAYLRTLKADLVKIDGGFVKDMHRDPQNRVIVESIHSVAQAFGLRTVAEWVENDAILEELRKIGIDYAQGYCTGRPLPVEEWGLSGSPCSSRPPPRDS